ncbi:hypothetical protein [Mycobacterium sp. Marseille-P9652]|uniref:hypothetical protein n=1 Tax=Mycobacterium sp. Marseille-P9652 TaxID=2654950 RepID=UPI0012E8703C|nr:hypothetical protein [Mycobacterium sp. Marseille-P9652]
MSISSNSVRRAVVGAVGAGAVAGGLLFGASGTAQATPAPGPASTAAPADAPMAVGFDNAPMPDWWLHHRLFHRWWWFW